MVKSVHTAVPVMLNFLLPGSLLLQRRSFSCFFHYSSPSLSFLFRIRSSAKNISLPYLILNSSVNLFLFLCGFIISPS